MSVDIILCCYNNETTIRQCVESIIGQSYKDFNLFVFDDNSNDKTVKILESISDDRIKVLKSNKNIGTYAGKNYVLKNYCKSEYVALHDADDISFSKRIEKQIQFLDTNSSYSACGSWVFEKNNEKQNLTKVKYPKELSRINLQKLIEKNKITLKDVYNLKLCMNGTLIFRRSKLIELNGWDGKTRIGADTEIFLRIMRTSKIHNLQECLYIRKIHENSLTRSKDAGYNSKKRNEYIFENIIETISSGSSLNAVYGYYPQNINVTEV